ncbi:MAG TPA: 1-deoxy-D-xylulose-5-phosphate reductoisomerase [Verrucomicrobia bacterium]|nr:1-deoxy-D-xylulose-5-phosphate reductoisomerase [Verrucomicrobiales bacterium]HIL55350.1 1-deoxy-D-xylulose-5-phosphate reductoisomerase [Verrucomicrobiota bacterium]
MANSTKKVVILGSTGSIGVSALKVANDLFERIEIVGLGAYQSADKLLSQLNQTGARAACLSDQDVAESISADVPSGVDMFSGEEGLVELATLEEADIVLIAIVGVAGLKPALAALEAGKDLAVASKEILVMAGQEIMETASRTGSKVLPVDSEHNAIFQCLEGKEPDTVSRLILTASGGPFRKYERKDLENVSVEKALNHPTWDMGPKITVDSATLFNKGLEMIEARWLFDIEMDRVDVIVHPQSIVHSMVEFIDGSILAQLSVTDMCFPIQYALTWPERVPNSLPPVDFADLGKLDFEKPRTEDFPALNLARAAGNAGGTLPAVMNAANEIAVAQFLKGQLSFPGIWEHVESVMTNHKVIENPAIDELIEADQWARIYPIV